MGDAAKLGAGGMNDVTVGTVRTVAPAVAGAVAAWLLKQGVDIDPTVLQLVVFPAFVGLYYRLVRLAEGRWPWVGVLLGVAKTPSYAKG